MIIKSHLNFRSGKFNVHINVFNIVGDKNRNNNIILCMERVSTKYNMLLPTDQLHKINGS